MVTISGIPIQNWTSVPSRIPNPDMSEISATKTPRHKEKDYLKNLVSWCLRGENFLIDISYAKMM